MPSCSPSTHRVGGAHPGAHPCPPLRTSASMGREAAALSFCCWMLPFVLCFVTVPDWRWGRSGKEPLCSFWWVKDTGAVPAFRMGVFCRSLSWHLKVCWGKRRVPGCVGMSSRQRGAAVRRGMGSTCGTDRPGGAWGDDRKKEEFGSFWSFRAKYFLLLH